jgi:hypothetical protein
MLKTSKIKRASNSGVSLDADEVAIVKGMLNRGDRQHDIAAWFGVNGGRIAEIANEKKHKEIKPKTKGLPPPGPYLAGKDAEAAIIALEAAQETIASALSLISERRKKYAQ